MKQLILSLAMSFCLIMVATTAFAQGDAFCTSIKGYNKMAATNFKEVQGELNEEETEIEEEDVFNTTTMLPGFEHGIILPTFTEGKNKIQFYNLISDESEANAFLKSIKTQLDACLNVAAGFKAREDSGIYFYESTTVSLQLMRSLDSDENGDSIYKVLVQLNKR